MLGKICINFVIGPVLSLVALNVLVLSLLPYIPLPKYDYSTFSQQDLTIPDNLRYNTVPIRGSCRSSNSNNNNATLSVITVGENLPSSSNQKCLMFLHGYPDSALLLWHHQLQYFATANKYFIIAPDQRGYNNSYAPSEAMAYSLDELVEDIVQVMEWSQCKGRTILVAHDWG